MVSEVRRVPKDWKHPKDEAGEFIPLLSGNFKEQLKSWLKGKQQWDLGFYLRNKKWVKKTPDITGTYEDWDSECPKEEDFMPGFLEAEKTHYQMYEESTEGTPISPVMETPEALAHWLADNNASAEQRLAIINKGWSVCMVLHISSALKTKG